MAVDCEGATLIVSKNHRHEADGREPGILTIELKCRHGDFGQCLTPSVPVFILAENGRRHDQPFPE